MKRSAFDSTQVEHVPDQPAEPHRLEVDRSGDRSRLVRVQRDIGVHEIPGRGPDRRQRRAQVVGDRIEQRRLEGVALPGHFRLGGFGGETVAHHRLAELIGRRGQNSRVRPTRHRIPDGARGPDRADRLEARLDRHPKQRLGFYPFATVWDPLAAGAGYPFPGASGAFVVDPDPVRLSLGRGCVEQPARSDRGSGLAGHVAGHDPLVAGGGSEPDPDTRHLGLAGQSLGQTRSGLERGGGGGDFAAHGEHRLRLGRAELGFLAPLHLERAQPPDGDGHDEEEQQVQPFFGRGDREGVEGLNEKEVV